MPTAAERRGDFSQSLDVFGRPVRLVDPATGAPFAGNVIPQARISPQAASLLRLYPATNVDGPSTSLRANYETPVLAATRQDALQLRFMETLNPKNQLTGNVSLQRTTTDTANVFGFVDAGTVSGIDVPITFYHRFSQFLSMRLRYQHTRLATDVTPHFANRENVAGDAGIGGINQDPVNWGPPTLNFSSGIAGLSSAQFASNRDRTHGLGGESIWSRGRHTITAGGDARVRRLDIVSQQNARGDVHVHRRRDRIGCGGLSARPAARERDRLRQRRQVPPRDQRGRLRDRRLARESHSHRQHWFALGIRIAVQRAVRPSRESRHRARIHISATGCRQWLPPRGRARISAAHRRRLAARGRIVARHPRRLRHLSELVGLSGADAVARAAAAAVDDGQCGEQRGASAHARQWVRRPHERHAEYVRGRPRFPRRLRTQLAAAGAARSARVADDHRHLSRHEEQSPDAGTVAEHVSDRRRQSVPCVSGRLRLSDLERKLDTACGPGAAAAPAAQWADGIGAVHARESHGRRGGGVRGGSA